MQTPAFSSFDYTAIHGIPEQTLRVNLLAERLSLLAAPRAANILEVGIGGGDVTLMLNQRFSALTCIDSDAERCGAIRQMLQEMQLPGAMFISAPVEEVSLDDAEYDHIVLFNILEHLEDPVAALKKLGKACASSGRIHITVPLAHSLHRHLGVAMGMMDDAGDLAESDIHFGHYRVYTRDSLVEHVTEAQLLVHYEKSFYLKPLPTAQLTPLPMEIHQGLFALGEQFPQFASYIYLEVGH